MVVLILVNQDWRPMHAVHTQDYGQRFGLGPVAVLAAGTSLCQASLLQVLARANFAGQVNNLAFNFIFLACNPMCCSKVSCTASPFGMATWKAASMEWTTSGRVALGDRVSILKEACLWWVAKGSKAGEKNLLSDPESQRQLTCIVSPSFTRVILLVRKVLLPRVPLLMESRIQAAISPSTSVSILTAAPTNVAGMCPPLWVVGDGITLCCTCTVLRSSGWPPHPP